MESTTSKAQGGEANQAFLTLSQMASLGEESGEGAQSSTVAMVEDRLVRSVQLTCSPKSNEY